MAALALLCMAADKQPDSEAVVCTVEEDNPAPCRFQDSIDRNNSHVMVFKSGGARHVFVGKEQSEWWSGTFDGSPAMAVELNRGHTKISTMDLKHRFEWWYPDMEHGTY